MKSKFLILFSLISIYGFGQTHMIGMQGGLNITNLTANKFFLDMDSRYGFIGGLNYEILFSNKLTASTDLLYNQHGFRDEIIFTDNVGISTGEKFYQDFNYDYLSLPLKFGYVLGNRFYGFSKIGICPSMLIKAERVIPNFELDGPPKGTISIKENDVTMFDLSGLIELGFGFRILENIKLFSSAMYRKSFNTFSNTNYWNDNKMRHYGYTISIGLQYTIKK